MGSRGQTPFMRRHSSPWLRSASSPARPQESQSPNTLKTPQLPWKGGCARRSQRLSVDAGAEVKAVTTQREHRVRSHQSFAQCNTFEAVDLLDGDDLAVYLRAVRTFALLAERSAESVGLTLAQMRLLFTVSDLGVASCSAVAAKLHVSVSSVTRLVARPAMVPLVSRSVSPANASAVDLELTARGAATVWRVTDCRERVLRAALAGTDAATALAASLGLRHIIDRIADEVRV